MLKDIAFVGLTYWLVRSSAALLRGRISQEQFKRRVRSYGQILLA
jgi:hypothetical protein